MAKRQGPKAPAAEGSERAPSPISKAALAAKKGVTASAISKAVLPGGPLEAAHLSNGRIDLEHPATQAWLSATSSDVADGGAPVSKAPKPDDIEELGDLSLREIVDLYGSIVGFADHVDVRKKIAETHRIELANAETEGDLISRDLVRTHVFGMIDAVQRRLLTDTAKTVASRIFQLVKAGGTLEEAERATHDLVSANLAPLKTSAARTLREQK